MFMKNAKSRFMVVGILVTLTWLFLAAGPVQADDLKLQVICPNSIVPGQKFVITVNAYNNSPYDISFNRVVVAYMNPDLTVKGPYVVSQVEHIVPPNYIPPAANRGAAISPYDPYVFKIPFTIETSQTGGALVPVIVSLWWDNYTQGNQRGTGAGAAKIKPGWAGE